MLGARVSVYLILGQLLCFLATRWSALSTVDMLGACISLFNSDRITNFHRQVGYDFLSPGGMSLHSSDFHHHDGATCTVLLWYV